MSHGFRYVKQPLNRNKTAKPKMSDTQLKSSVLHPCFTLTSLFAAILPWHIPRNLWVSQLCLALSSTDKPKAQPSSMPGWPVIPHMFTSLFNICERIGRIDSNWNCGHFLSRNCKSKIMDFASKRISAWSTTLFMVFPHGTQPFSTLCICLKFQKKRVHFIFAPTRSRVS